VKAFTYIGVVGESARRRRIRYAWAVVVTLCVLGIGCFVVLSVLSVHALLVVITMLLLLAVLLGAVWLSNDRTRSKRIERTRQSGETTAE